MNDDCEITSYLPAIRTLHDEQHLTKYHLLQDPFLMHQFGDLCMYYAPHNEYINKEAVIVIVGITPGWHQMKMAVEQVLKDLKNNIAINDMLKNAKHAASFSGAMRTNLIQMLDECDLPNYLSIKSTASLFNENRHLLHTTSVIKYPVFYQNKNYTGHQPRIDQCRLLSYYAFEVFPKELKSIQQATLVISLGKAVDQVISYLKQSNKLPEQHTYLLGFPHPSGANGHRLKQFEQHKNSFKHAIKKFYSSN